MKLPVIAVPSDFDPNRSDVREYFARHGWRWCAAGVPHVWNAWTKAWVYHKLVQPPPGAVLPGRTCPAHRAGDYLCVCREWFGNPPGLWCSHPWEHVWDGFLLEAVRDRWPRGWFLRPGLGARALLVLPAGSPVRTLRRRARERRFVVGVEREAGPPPSMLPDRGPRFVSVEVGIADLAEVLADYSARARVVAGLEADDGRRRGY